jgi:hypothetical protein
LLRLVEVIDANTGHRGEAERFRGLYRRCRPRPVLRTR